MTNLHHVIALYPDTNIEVCEIYGDNDKQIAEFSIGSDNRVRVHAFFLDGDNIDFIFSDMINIYHYYVEFLNSVGITVDGT